MAVHVPGKLDGIWLAILKKFTQVHPQCGDEAWAKGDNTRWRRVEIVGVGRAEPRMVSEYRFGSRDLLSD